MTKHTLKSMGGGAWLCEACRYTTYNEEKARQHWEDPQTPSNIEDRLREYTYSIYKMIKLGGMPEEVMASSIRGKTERDIQDLLTAEYKRGRQEAILEAIRHFEYISPSSLMPVPDSPRDSAISELKWLLNNEGLFK